MSRPEDNLYARVAKRLKIHARKHPLWFMRTHGGGRTKKGIPDVRIVFYGLSIDAELKVGDNDPTKLQLAKQDEIRKAGGFVANCYSVDEVDELLARALRFLHRPAEAFGGGAYFCPRCRLVVYPSVDVPRCETCGDDQFVSLPESL